METLKFQDAEIAGMRRFYQEELDKTLRRLEHIKSVLDKLGGSVPSVHIKITPFHPQAEQVQAEDTAPEKAVVKNKRQKSGPKSLWEELVMKRLRQLDKPLTYEQLTDEIMVFGKIPQEKRKNTKQAIINVVFRLRNRQKRLRTFSDGTKEKHIALRSWFDESGELKEEYRKKITGKKKKKKTRTASGRSGGILKPKQDNLANNPTWSEYVLEMLKIEDKPMLVKTMTERTMNRFNIKSDLYDKARLAVARSMTLLDKKEKLVKRHLVNGKMPGYYGLKDWFDEAGILKKEYEDRIPSTATVN